MCGIFGIVPKKDSILSPELLQKSADRLFRLSESRGKEASGLALFCNGKITTYKRPEPASMLIRSEEYKQLFHKADNFALIGHARLVTNGSLEDNRNNQPVAKEGMACVHNGIVVNDKEIWEIFPQLKREYEVDTEVILALVDMFIRQGGSLVEAVQNTFNIIRGSASIALLAKNPPALVLATNTGSLYTVFVKDKNIFVFASENCILKGFLGKTKQANLLGHNISQIKPGNGLLLELSDFNPQEFAFAKTGLGNAVKETITQMSPEAVRSFVPKRLFCDVSPLIGKLRRCTKCILPETMPFIEFDEQGVCNYCRNYQKVEVSGEEKLEKAIAPYRSASNKTDVIVTLSGGRDSSFALHYAKKVLGLNPVAYSYDWGMLTDLGRRNQARMCGGLGVEHILVSADIRKKRENIKKNVLAWLRKPSLGTVPLFMAGDKQYFYYANKLMKQTGVKQVLFGSNPYEKTDFKYGFSNLKPAAKVYSAYSYSTFDKLKLAAYYAGQFVENPSFLNSSLIDTFTAYLSYYFIPHNYLFFYRYKQWDEEEIISTLRGLYNWELANDTKDTWRIGDGTAAFYNYIYYLIAGFTENDTFRSNQIREGFIKRDEALAMVKESNQPRFPSIKWYCDIIGIDFGKTLQIINAIPRLY